MATAKPAKEKVAKVKKEKVEKVKKEKSPSKRSLAFPDFKLKFKKDQEVKFTPFRETKQLKGVIVSSFPYKPKSGEVREDVRIRVGTKTYIKKGSEVEVVK